MPELHRPSTACVQLVRFSDCIRGCNVDGAAHHACRPTRASICAYGAGGGVNPTGTSLCTAHAPRRRNTLNRENAACHTSGSTSQVSLCLSRSAGLCISTESFVTLWWTWTKCQAIVNAEVSTIISGCGAWQLRTLLPTPGHDCVV